MMKLRILRWGDCLEYPRGPHVLTRVPVRGRQAEQSQRKIYMTEAEARVMCFEDGGQGHQPRSAGGLCTLSEIYFSAFSVPRRKAALLTLIFSQTTQFGLGPPELQSNKLVLF